MKKEGIKSGVASSFCFKTMLLATTLLAGTPAFAQDNAPGTVSATGATTRADAQTGQAAGDDIVVTARRRDERIQDVPIAITAIGGASLTRDSIVKLEDVQRVAPALQITPSGFGSSVPRFTIRSQSQYEGLLTLDPSVAVYFADVVQARPHGINAGLYDIASIQVLKGPQGTLFGRNTTGGAILIAPNAPSDVFEGQMTANVGNYDLVSLEGMVNIPVSDNFQVRAAGRIVRRDGYTVNRANGARYDDEKSDSWRISAKFSSGDFTNVVVVNGFHEHDNGSAMQATYFDPNGLAALAWPGLLTALADQQKSDFHSFATEMAPGQNRVTAIGVSNTSTLNLGDVTLKNIFGYRHVKSVAPADYDGSTLPVFATTETLDANQISDEFQVLGKSLDNALDWIAGAYYFRESGRDIQDAVLNYEPFFFQDSRQNGQVVNESKSIFAQATYRPPGLSALGLTAGVRYTWDDRALTGSGRLNGGCAIVDGAGQPLDPCSRTVAKSFGSPTYTVTLDYKIDDKRMVYITHRQGYRSGGFNLRAAAPAEFVPYSPEHVKDVEVGLKADWNIGTTRLRTNIAAYYQDYSDIQRVQAAVIGNVLVTTIVNAAAAEVKGVEFDGTWTLDKHLELRGFYALSDARYKKWLVPLGGGAFQDRTSFEFSYAPRDVAGGSIRYNADLPGDAGNVALQGDVYYQSHIQFQDENYVPYGVGKAYTVGNARVEWNGIMGSNVSAAFWVRNLTDTKYNPSGTPINGFGSVVSTIGPPRTFGVELRVGFGS